ncbi:glycosyltransferase, partial [candidate division CSSED10-310 bacterium]
MKILFMHNYYRLPGGEDRVFELESSLLEKKGNQVVKFSRHNSELDRMSRLNKVFVALNMIWSPKMYRKMKKMLRSLKPDVVHFHNVVPLLTPSLYYACKSEGVAAVQTLHNYRMICPGGKMLRQKMVCEDCLCRFPWPAVVHGCYRDSKAATFIIGASFWIHRLIGKWTENIDLFIALTDFSRMIFIKGGIPEKKLVVKPNFTRDIRPHYDHKGYALYV